MQRQGVGPTRNSSLMLPPQRSRIFSGTYGTLSMENNGLWTYTLNNSLPAVQALGQNDTAQDIFTVNADDGHGGIR